MSKPAASKSETSRLYASYFTGFGVSVMLTLAAFALTKVQFDSEGTAYSGLVIIGLLLGLAIIQLVIQLVFFFHLGREPKPKLNTVSFLFYYIFVNPDILEYVRKSYAMPRASDVHVILTDMVITFLTTVLMGILLSAVVSFFLKNKSKKKKK